MNICDIFNTDNNKLKYQGKPMIRRVHLLKARNKRIKNWTYCFRKSQESFVKLDKDVREMTSSTKEFIAAINRIVEEQRQSVLGGEVRDE